MKNLIQTVALSALMAGLAGRVYAEPKAHEDLAKEAKISEADARKVALARAPGQVQSEELEREHHHLIYSYDIKQAGKSGITEVQVDAKSGKIVSVQHETPAKEKQESKHEEK